MKISVAVLFGGKSVEHEVSVISAVQAMASMDRSKYDVVPVYITKNNEMWHSDRLTDIAAYTDIPTLLETCRRVEFRVAGDRTFLTTTGQGLFAKKQTWLIDVAFPIVHGTNVEDGALQGFLETVNLPYVGPNVLGSAVGMDKFVMKVMLDRGGFPTVPGLRFTTADWESDAIVAQVEAAMEYPVIVKPVNLGSSVGIGRAADAEQLRRCCDDAFAFARHVIVETAVPNLREINCSVIGDEEQAEASECEEPVMSEAILSYADKYVSGGKASGKSSGGKASKAGMASLKRLIPAPIGPEQREQVRALAVDAFRFLDLNGVTRVDFLMDGVTGQVWINEVNTIPGSLAFYLWEPVGLAYPQLLDRLIQLALKRARQDADRTYAFDTNILAGASLGPKGGKTGR
ncbi:MAG: D-alanine--D-alanine ligase [Propionibacteriaceae bacterium]|jgi:D-alanine-D-alanine ligase|nr:D-alanine--D-alanine ligase [Propionibacteriaceae bacterium]